MPGQWLEAEAIDLLLEVPRREVPVDLGRDPRILVPHDPLHRCEVRVFITHGKQRSIVEEIKELLAFGNFDPVVSVE